MRSLSTWSKPKIDELGTCARGLRAGAAARGGDWWRCWRQAFRKLSLEVQASCDEVSGSSKNCLCPFRNMMKLRLSAAGGAQAAHPRMLLAAIMLLTPAAFAAKVHSTSRGVSMSFDDFISVHGRSYRKGSQEYEERGALFETRRVAALLQNNRSDAKWSAAINKFSDRKEEELKVMHGYKPAQVRQSQGLSFAAEEEDHSRLKSALPEKVDWRHLSDGQTIVEQGGCGSCWAISATTVLNAHSEIHRGRPRRFSSQELVNCVPNPQECGGQGGCSGATVELGIGWAVQHGLSLETSVPYSAQDGTCENSFLQAQGLRGATAGGASFGLTGFRVLPSNKEDPLARALVELGPVAVSVAASNWFSYEGGVFDECDNIVNHAVALYGYGRSDGHRFWLVKNSWGSDWGENGYIRLLRRDSEDQHCGIDTEPDKGIACKGGPKEVTV
eukprot:s3592_g3.t1